MLSALVSLILLHLFSELASANFKRLAPVLEAWEKTKSSPDPAKSALWKSGFEKLAVLCWAIGASIPLLAFTVACNLFLPNDTRAANFIFGASIGSNNIALSLAFGVILLSGPLSFFRVRTITSPVFLLLATVAFSYACLNESLSRWEGFFLLLLGIAYGFYFRRFSSEWKYYERTNDASSLVESSEGSLPMISILCMGFGFFVLAVLSAQAFVLKLSQFAELGRIADTKLAVHLVSFLLALPWLVRATMSLRQSDTARAITLTNLSHSCLLNMLLLTGIHALVWTPEISGKFLAVDLPILLILTGTFVSTLLIEKESGGKLTFLLIGGYLLYTGLGVFT